ncbi:hypothetical protein SeLEV6574_g06285 [Synchytrium endobioticum]|uniref:Uncharacterized protein n=1 Tax=Synchytrium endobioticum TaxID=286115 RepID=A0A507CPI1_9FUNG|nr:hypothetical protein SeLEV6574_g06285 [Synchytrium endobioticum]
MEEAIRKGVRIEGGTSKRIPFTDDEEKEIRRCRLEYGRQWLDNIRLANRAQLIRKASAMSRRDTESQEGNIRGRPNSTGMLQNASSLKIRRLQSANSKSRELSTE